MVTHWIVATVVPSSCASVCSATLTIVVSKTTARTPISMTPARRSRALITLFAVQMADYLIETGTTPADLRDEFLSARTQPLAYDVLMKRAAERGEIDPERLTPRILSLPGDLIRHEVLMTLKPAGHEAIIEIVDEIFLPLVRKSR